MARHENESAIDYLRRMISYLDYEEEGILQALPEVEAVLEYVALLAHYDVETLDAVFEAIQDGADAGHYVRFRNRNMPSKPHPTFIHAFPSVGNIKAGKA